MLKNQPAQIGVAVVVIQHLDPKHRSLTADILLISSAIPRPLSGRFSRQRSRLCRFYKLERLLESDSACKDNSSRIVMKCKEGVSAQMEAVKGSLRNLRVLIVDDDQDTREMLRFVLDQEGGQVTAASTVEEALEEYKDIVPNVVVVDIGMPGANGYAL